MKCMKCGLLLLLVLAVTNLVGVDSKQDHLLKLEKVETPKYTLFRRSPLARTSHGNNNARLPPDVLLQVLGLKGSTTTTTHRYPTYWPTHPPYPKPPPTKYPHPHPHPHPHPPYPYPHYPYPYYPWPWGYPWYPYPPYPTPRPTPSPTPAPTPAPIPPPAGGIPPSPGNVPEAPMMRDEIREYGLDEGYDPEKGYQSRNNSADEEDNDSAESILRVHKPKRRKNKSSGKRPHIIRINVDKTD